MFATYLRSELCNKSISMYFGSFLPKDAFVLVFFISKNPEGCAYARYLRRRYSRERASQSLEVIQFMHSFASLPRPRPNRGRRRATRKRAPRPPAPRAPLFGRALHLSDWLAAFCQTFKDSFSGVSKPIFAWKYSLGSS